MPAMPQQQSNKKAPDLKTLPPRQLTRFNSSIVPHSKFSGFGPAVDAEWDRFTESPIIDGTSVVLAVSTEEIISSGKIDDDRVPFDTTVPIGDKYMATVETFHQLHCLNILRKFLHRDYYKDQDPFFATGAKHAHSSMLKQCVDETG